jgi:hypothetical protein
MDSGGEGGDEGELNLLYNTFLTIIFALMKQHEYGC